MSSKIYSVELSGLDGQLVEIEVDTRMSLPGFSIVGLPDTAVQEARERVISAVRNMKVPLPRGKIVVNLAPADLRKVGSRYDLPIALGLLSFCGLLSSACFKDAVFLGELALDGTVRPVSGSLISAESAWRHGFKRIFVPKENASEAGLIKGIRTIPIGHLKEAVMHLNKELFALPIAPAEVFETAEDFVDMSQIRGQARAKRALEIAAAGGHNVLLSGAPGAGKTLLARALSGILPDMTQNEILEVTKIYSAAGFLRNRSGLMSERPFRRVHHTATPTSIVGGGTSPRPGEITLAHRGVLFLDEIAEFSPRVLEVLRQPMEDRCVTISRLRGRITYPCQFTLVAAMNPCPCGYHNVSRFPGRCQCSKWKVEDYLKKMSGPLLDRIDIRLRIEPVDTAHLDLCLGSPEASDIIRRRVNQAHEIQVERYKNERFMRNSEMDLPDIERHCTLSAGARKTLQRVSGQYQLSARSYYKALKLARTIADIEQCDCIVESHMGEALQYLCTPLKNPDL